MKQFLPIVAMLFVSFALSAQDQPQPSAQPFKQGLYEMYMRDYTTAIQSFRQAYFEYKEKEIPDSASLSLLYLARMKTITLDVDSAQTVYDQALALAASLSEETPMIKAMKPYVEGGLALMSFQIEKADSLIPNAIKSIEENISPCNLYLINTMVDLGILRHVQRRFTEADSIVSRALSCGLSLYDSTDMRLMASYNMLGAIADGMGYSKRSIRYYRMALRCMEENGLRDSYDYGRLLNNLANVLYAEGGQLKAIELLEESISITQQHRDFSNNTSGAYYNIANMLFSIGYRNKAVEYLDKAEQSVDSVAIWSIPHFYHLFQLRSRLHALLGNNLQSERDYERAVEIVNGYYGEGSVILADLQLMRSHTLSAQGRINESLFILKNGIRDFETYGWDPLENNLGEFYYLAADLSLQQRDTASAIEYNKKAIKEYQGAPPLLQLEMAFPNEELASIFLSQNQIDSARIYIERSLRGLVHDPDDFDFFEPLPLDAYVRFHSFRHILGTKIDVLLAFHNRTEDLKYLQLALDETTILEEHLEENTSTYLEDEDVIERVKVYWPLYEKIIATRVKAFEVMGEESYLIDAIRTSERTKDILYKMSLRKVSAVDALGLDVELAEREEQFEADIESIESEIYSIQLDSVQSKLDSLEKRLVEVKRSFDLFKKKISEENPRYYEARYTIADLDVRKLQSYLAKRNATLINYFAGDSRFMAFVISSDDIHVMDLGYPIVVNGVIDSAITSLRKAGSTQPLEELYRRVFSPLEKYIKEENLIIVPDGKLHFIPFEALSSNANQFLVEDYNILYSHSISPLLVEAEGLNLKRALGVAPGFENSIKTRIANLVPESPLLDLIRQPNAISLVESVRQIMPADVLLAEEASETHFKKSLQTSDLLILATHAEVDEAHPLYSRIALLPQAGSSDDGLLHVYEILGMDMQQDLAILTACETGLGALDRGQGAASLSHAFRYAGCQNIIMSLWSIDEKQSTELMRSYIRDINDGEDITSALTNVKRTYLKDARGELRHPYYWAGLVLVGHGSDAYSVWAGVLPGLLIFIVLIILIGGGWVLRRQSNETA